MSRVGAGGRSTLCNRPKWDVRLRQQYTTEALFTLQSVEWHALFVEEDFLHFLALSLIIKHWELDTPEAGIVAASNATWYKKGPYIDTLADLCDAAVSLLTVRCDIQGDFAPRPT